MAEQHDIDQLFRDRFEGAKNHSANPSEQWAAFEDQLNASMSVSGAVSSAASGSSFWTMAASFATIVSVAGLATQDSPSIDYLPDAGAAGGAYVVDMPQQEEAPQAEMFTAFEKVLQETHNSSHLEEVVVSSERPSRLEPSPSISSSSQDNSMALFATAEGLKPNRSIDVLPLMKRRTIENSTQGLVGRDPLESLEGMPYLANAVYLRGGVRFGNGESNSVNDPAQWRMNGLLAVGYKYSLNARTFVSAELGWMRRSGSGVERSKDVDLEPLASILISTYGTGSPEEIEYKRSAMNIRESLVAKRMDYIHLPVAVHVNLNARSNVSVGAYANYLIGVENDSYMVYNSKDYIKADFGVNDEKTLDGLNRWRVGLQAGYERCIFGGLSADVRALLPITSVYDRTSDYYQHSEPNQLVDLQLSLKYKI